MRLTKQSPITWHLARTSCPAAFSGPQRVSHDSSFHTVAVRERTARPEPFQPFSRAEAEISRSVQHCTALAIPHTPANLIFAAFVEDDLML